MDLAACRPSLAGRRGRFRGDPVRAGRGKPRGGSTAATTNASVAAGTAGMTSRGSRMAKQGFFRSRHELFRCREPLREPDRSRREPRCLLSLNEAEEQELHVGRDSGMFGDL